MKKAYGFTIVELLIVIVVIAILAAISVAAYTSITDRANDSSVQGDLRSIGQKFSLYKVEHELWPVTLLQIGSTGVEVSKSAYGNHATNIYGEYNLPYCVNGNGAGDMAIVGASESGNAYVYHGGSVSDYDGYWGTGIANLCEAAGVDNWTHRTWMLEADEWKAFLD